MRRTIRVARAGSPAVNSSFFVAPLMRRDIVHGRGPGRWGCPLCADKSCVVEYWLRGTHTGKLVARAGTLPPTGRKLEIRICDVMEIQGGKITNLRSYWDLYGVLSQLGLIPEAAHP